MRKRLLFISKDATLIQAIKSALQNETTEIDCFPNAAQALRHCLKQPYCLLLADVDRIDGEISEVLRTMRRSRLVPILVLVDTMTSSERTILLRSGATAYLKKPFSAEECAAQVNSLIRLYTDANPDISRYHTIAFGTALIIDPSYWQVTQNGTPVELTYKEFNLLYYLASHEGQVMTHEQIYSHVWKNESEINLEGTIKTHISSLRQKLSAENRVFIESVRSVGYRFAAVSRHPGGSERGS